MRRAKILIRLLSEVQKSTATKLPQFQTLSNIAGITLQEKTRI
jgi:hypothetical protein